MKISSVKLMFSEYFLKLVRMEVGDGREEDNFVDIMVRDYGFNKWNLHKVVDILVENKFLTKLYSGEYDCPYPYKWLVVTDEFPDMAAQIEELNRIATDRMWEIML